MIRSILVGLNGSTDTPAVVDFAVQTAQRADAMLAVTGIIDVPTITHSEPVPLGGASFKYGRDAERIAKARKLSGEAIEQLIAKAHGAGVRYSLLPTVEDTGAQLVANAPRFDLIVLGHLGMLDIPDSRDPVLDYVLHHATRPVVSVPGRLGKNPATVIAYDGSLQANRALQLFTAVWHPIHEVHVVSADQEQAVATQHAEIAREYLHRHGIEPTTHAFANGVTPAEVILDVVDRISPELLVMGAYGKPSWREFFFGTVTKSILAKNAVPMFLYH